MIRVSNLGKKYTLRHKVSQSGGYRRLSEDLAYALTWPARRLHRAFSNSNGSRSHNGSKEDFWALREVTFDIQQGEVVGIIGRNGAGKSTLLKLLSRITEPTTGRIELHGRVASLLEVGTGFHPELTGRENIFLNGAILGMTRGEIKRKFDEIVSFAEVEKFLDTPVKHFSSGMYVRLAFSVAAHLESEIVIVDEVLAVGDMEFQKRCLGKMQEVSSGGRTVLFVSHNMGAVATLCDMGILLDQGQIQYSGTCEETIRHYSACVKKSAGGDEILDEQRVRGLGTARIIRARLRSPGGLPKSEFTIGEPLELELEFEGEPDTSGSAWVIVSSANGTALCSAFMRDNNAPVTLSGKGLIQVRLESFGLLPGHYSISAGLLSQIGDMLDWCEQVTQFEVLGYNYDGRAFDYRLGMLSQRLKWSHCNEKRL